MKALITRKVGMTSILDEAGSMLPITLLSAATNTITQTKTTDKDGYVAVQLGFEVAKKLNKPATGHAKASKIMPKVIREIKLVELEEGTSVGQEIKADVFSVGDMVNVTATSKGKGFAGTIKRHNFKRGRKTHGGRSYRRPGSIGSMYPQKVFKGLRMAGRMGNEQVTTRNLKIALVDVENSIIGVIGAVPGAKKSIVMIKEAKK